MIVTGAWERCPFQHPEGWGRCTLLDASAPHRGTDGELRHVCDPDTGTRGYKGRPGGKRMAGETRLRKRPGFVKAAVSKRDQARWARKEDGQAVCPRISPKSGTACHLIDNPSFHESGHEGVNRDGGTLYNWSIDREDWTRWSAALPGGEVLIEAGFRPGTPMPPMEPEHYPRPPGWDDTAGADYAFSIMPSAKAREGDEFAAIAAWQGARDRALVEIARYGRRPVGNPTMFMASDHQWLLWFRTEENADAR